MRRRELEHLIRAASQITDDDELIIVGSQSILGQFPDAPEELLFSREADMYPVHQLERSILISGALGELGMFHDTYGYWADGVGPETAALPPGWRDRLVPIRNENTRGAVGWCLEIHDLLISKLAAGRTKDLDFAVTAVDKGLARRDLLLTRAEAFRSDSQQEKDIKETLDHSLRIVLKRIR